MLVSWFVSIRRKSIRLRSFYACSCFASENQALEVTSDRYSSLYLVPKFKLRASLLEQNLTRSKAVSFLN